MKEFRCKKCNKLLGKYQYCKELEIKCPRCGAKNVLQQMDYLVHEKETCLDSAVQ